ncbi:hypothetical protein EXIGLDRAFT_475002 [Exidia glandulosa HHB12029]|uniref:Uncharacterized protein n=1 Tax=Exidia glandulosa HHB12029 TaxID=1314781 RepID=A0A165JWK1_EXIGL|nr:hypothetical protein EXIGLDRAFT_475002 [Exidia glandulosa HHB12029]
MRHRAGRASAQAVSRRLERAQNKTDQRPARFAESRWTVLPRSTKRRASHVDGLRRGFEIDVLATVVCAGGPRARVESGPAYDACRALFVIQHDIACARGDGLQRVLW